MGKRATENTFEKRPRDFYGTIDPDAVMPLLPFVRGRTYAEPCVGDGDLLSLLHSNGIHCRYTSDVDPDRITQSWVKEIKDGKDLTLDDIAYCDLIITNPPFTWKILEPLLKHLPTLKPTWLLLPADIIHNRRMAPYMERCHDIVSVGRLYWMPNKVKGVDNFVWLNFDFNKTAYITRFHGRT